MQHEEEGDHADQLFPLKNGAGRWKFGDIRVAQEELHLLLRQDAELFSALRAVVDGRNHEVSQEQLQKLREWEMMTEKGKARPDIEAVILAGCRDTPCGPILTEPFDLSNPEHAAIVEKHDRAMVPLRDWDWKRDARFRLALLDEERKNQNNR